MAEEPLRCGYVAVVGRPNVGKSTLVNRLVGEKITIVTGKPQTTRHNILGVMNGPAIQVIYVDTPGIHEHRGREINRAMNRSAVFAIEDADVVLFVCEATRWDAGDDYVLGQLAKARGPVIVALNKIDKLRRRELLLPRIDELQGRANFAAIVPVSALRGQQMEGLVGEIRDLLPSGPRLFPIDAKTDRDMSFRASELIREQLLEQIHREVPYGILVEVDIDDHDPAGTEVQATIWVERESHKAIVIGAGGRRLKSVGTKARLQLRDMLGKPVHVETHVRVKRNWSHSARVLRQHGIDSAGGSSDGG